MPSHDNVMAESSTGLFDRRKHCRELGRSSAHLRDASARSRDQSNRRSRDARVDAALMRAFPDFRADMIDNFVPPGEKCTLRVAVANVIFPDDVCEAVKLSNLKVRQLRALYAYEGICEKVLDITADDLKLLVNARLKAACELCSHSQMNLRDRDDMLGLLPSIKAANLREAKLLLSTLISLRPAAHESIRMFVIEACKAVKRAHIDTLYPSLVKSCKHIFMEAFNAQYNAEQNTNVSLHAFWHKFGDLIACFAHSEAKLVDELVAGASDDYATYLNHLVELLKQGVLFKSMFAWAYPEAISAHMGKFIDSQLVYPVGRLLTLADIDAITDRCLEEAARIGAKEHLRKKDRCREVTFKKYTFMYPVGGLAKEIRIRISVWLQNTNYGGDITPMRWEKSVVAPPSPKPRLCEADVLAGIKSAYADVDQLLESFDLDTLEFDDLVKMLVSRKGVWSANDPDFGLNICLLKGLSGDLGLERVKDAVMQALPSDVTDLDASDALSSLEVISGAVWFKYVKEEGQSIMATVKGALSDIAGSRDVRCASRVLGSTPILHGDQAALGLLLQLQATRVVPNTLRGVGG